MTSFKDMEEIHRTYFEDLKAAKQALIGTIHNMPDNPKINRLNDRCFTISSADLSSDLCLTPEYYDFVRQYKLIIQIIDERSTDRAHKLLTEIIQKGSIHYPSNTYHRFHPDVVAGLKKIME